MITTHVNSFSCQMNYLGTLKCEYPQNFGRFELFPFSPTSLFLISWPLVLDNCNDPSIIYFHCVRDIVGAIIELPWYYIIVRPLGG
jgi:hypothetical protein